MKFLFEKRIKLHHDFFLLLAITLFYRIIAIILSHEHLELSSARGFFSDIIQTLFFYILYYIIKIFFIRNIIIISYLVILACNYEHILTNNGHMSYEFAKYAFTKELILGSLLPSQILTSLGIATGFFYIFRKEKEHNHLFIYLLIISSSLFLIKIYSINSNWLQQSVLEKNIKSYIYNHLYSKNKIYYYNSSIDELKQKNTLYSKIQANDYNEGIKAIKNDLNKNILIIFIEGLSQEHIRHNKLKKIKELSIENYYIENFYTPQRQTNRGLYAALCGKYPNLISKFAKTDIISTYGPDTKCLPQILKENNYKTIFLQSADLAFMAKDLFLKKIGFESIIGNPKISSTDFRTKWGVDDKILYKFAGDLINQQKDKNWFISILTTSTHHPFITPKNPNNSDINKALEYADNAIYDFIFDLKNKGFLENTLVLITSDESNAKASDNWFEPLDFKTPIPDNHGLMVILGSGLLNSVNNQPFSQTDIPISILDYINIFPPETMKGRSFFRKYNKNRKIYFANVISDHFGYLEKKNFIICSSITFDCNLSYLKNKEIKYHKIPRPEKEIINITELNELNPIFKKSNKLLYRPDEFKYMDSNFYIIFDLIKFENQRNNKVTFEFELKNKHQIKIDLEFIITNTSTHESIRKHIICNSNCNHSNFFFNIESELLHQISIIATTDSTMPWYLSEFKITLEKNI